jgi:hypothetical protein
LSTTTTIDLALEGRKHMDKEIFARLSEESSVAQEERKYVLEDVFWVPESNCRDRNLVLADPPESRGEVRDIKNNSSPVKSKLDC